MPATYAHYRFGCECLERMPASLAAICRANRELFDFGLHGPDIFFYYHPLKSNEVSGYGSDMHHMAGRQVFTDFCKRYKESGSPDAMLSYMLGFLCHFAFDSAAHAYINGIADQGILSHNAVEAFYEAHLMREKHIEPLTMKRATLISPSETVAKTIAVFYDFDEKTIFTAIRGQKTVMQILYSPLQIKKYLLRKLIMLLKISGGFGDLFIDPVEPDLCKTTNKEIDRLRARARVNYPILLDHLMLYLKGQGDFNRLFDYNFEGEIKHEQG